MRTKYKNVTQVNLDNELILIPIDVKYLKTIMLQTDAIDSKMIKVFIKNPMLNFLNSWMLTLYTVAIASPLINNKNKCIGILLLTFKW